MEIKTTDLQQLAVSARQSKGDQAADTADDAVQKVTPVDTDKVSISNEAKQQSLGTASNRPTSSQTINNSDEALSVLSSIAAKIQQNPGQALDSVNPIPRDRIANLISQQPNFTQPQESSEAQTNVNRVSEQFNAEPEQALNSQANFDPEHASNLLE